MRAVIKKAKKTLALLSLHLSGTPCIQLDPLLQTYIIKKLNARKHEQHEKLKPIKFKDPEEIQSSNLDWRYQHELMFAAKNQIKDTLYYRNQQVIVPSDNRTLFNYILQRTLAHPEIEGNGNWHLNSECYICEHWNYTMIYKVSKEPIEIESSFTSLNYQGDRFQMKDVRIFAKQLLETSSDHDENFKTFNSTLPLDSKLGHRYSEVYKMFTTGNLNAYNHSFAWYHIIRRLVKLKQIQVMPMKPVPFKLDKFHAKLKLKEQIHNQMERSRYDKQMAEFKLLK